MKMLFSNDMMEYCNYPERDSCDNCQRW